MNKLIYLGLEILDISKTLMYEFWYDNLESEYDSNIGLCYMDTDSFIFHLETEDFYNDVDNRFDTSPYSKDLNRPLPIRKNKNVLGMKNDELYGKAMTHFCALKAKPYSCLEYDGKEEKKAKGMKKCVIKKRLSLMIIGLVILIVIQFQDLMKC